jgi:hypothetical protein
MEKRKIKFVGYYPGFEPTLSRAYNILVKHYDVELSDAPDYVFFSSFGQPYEYVNYDAVRIFYSAENYAPNFNTADYAVGFNEILYPDRYFRYPVSMYTPTITEANEKHCALDRQELLERPYFCNYIYGNANGQPARTEIFEKLNAYKHVESAGTYLNNQPDGWHAASIEEKLAFQRKCKFTIAFDSTQLAGFSTEKITHAFATRTIPIYLGDPHIGQLFNEQAFINGNACASVDEIVQRVIAIDQDEAAYFAMLSQPIFTDPDFLEKFEADYERFILHIFAQDKENAYRRSRVFFGKYDDNNLKIVNTVSRSKLLGGLVSVKAKQEKR